MKRRRPAGLQVEAFIVTVLVVASLLLSLAGWLVGIADAID